ncbi:MAG: ABC transporter ATP-binding protein [Pseudomonadota bacterium]
MANVAYSEGSKTEVMEPAQPQSVVPTSIRINDVHHTYGDTAAVRGVSLDVAAGEIVCLLGHSGCGKTTLLRLLAGIERPQQGDIAIGGRHVAGESLFVSPEHRGVGLMFQDFALFPHLTILDNVMFGLKHLKRDVARAEALNALDQVGLRHTASDHPHMLSGGMQQRVALARAIVPRPSVLLMDEPFSGLDRRTRDQVRDETLVILRDMGATTVVVTHDPDEALRIADRIVLMRAGCVVQDGSARRFYEEPADLFAARFFHELNEFEGVVKDAHVDTPLGSMAAHGFANGQAVLVGIRHASIEVQAAGQQAAMEGQVGRVRAVQFLGESDLLHIAVPSYERPIFVRTSLSDQFKTGQDVILKPNEDTVLVFQKPTA